MTEFQFLGVYTDKWIKKVCKIVSRNSCLVIIQFEDVLVAKDVYNSFLISE